jgi:alkylation response protein AidB-like acyl-CoA dehydrogenase
MAEGDRRGALGQTPLLLGNCRASVRLIEASGRGDASGARERLSALEERITLARASGDAIEGRRLRAAVGEWAVRFARLASLGCGGASLLEGHPAGRLYREALVFNLMAQTDDIVADAFQESFS